MSIFSSTIGRLGYWLLNKANVPERASDVLGVEINPWDSERGP